MPLDRFLSPFHERLSAKLDTESGILHSSTLGPSIPQRNTLNCLGLPAHSCGPG